MNANKAVIGTVLATFVIIGGAVWVGSTLQKPEIVASAAANATAPEVTHDWGTIPLNGGNVTKTFTIKNTGTDILQVHNVQSSCTCTTAQIVIDGQQSPIFAMHQKSAWVGEILPGEEAELEVSFDPAYHGPSGVGIINRVIRVETNDQSNPVLEFDVNATVIN